MNSELIAFEASGEQVPTIFKHGRAQLQCPSCGGNDLEIYRFPESDGPVRDTTVQVGPRGTEVTTTYKRNYKVGIALTCKSCDSGIFPASVKLLIYQDNNNVYLALYDGAGSFEGDFRTIEPETEVIKSIE